MSDRYKVHEAGGCYFMTCTVEGWIDIFSRERYRQIIIDSLTYCQRHKGLRIQGYVIMTNHIHLIAWVSGKDRLSDVMRDFKKFTAREILNTMQQVTESRRSWLVHMFKYFGKGTAKCEVFKFWQDGYHPIHIWTDDVFFAETKLYAPQSSKGRLC
jgi:putative transposase